MKRVFFPILLIFTIMFTGIGQASELWPLSIGNYWKLQTVGDPLNHGTLQVIGIANIGGVQAFVIEDQWTDHGDVDFGFVFGREINQVVYVYEGGGKVIIPFKTGPVGTEWSYTRGDGSLIVVEIMGIEDVTVPAGFFPGSYHYRETGYWNGQLDYSDDHWIHPGTGPVYFVDDTHLPPTEQDHDELVEYSVK